MSPADGHTLRLRRLGIDTHQETMLYMRRDSQICRSEGFTAYSRVMVRFGNRSIVATLNQVVTDILGDGEASLS